jgi:hypothetical protein
VVQGLAESVLDRLNGFGKALSQTFGADFMADLGFLVSLLLVVVVGTFCLIHR